MNEEFVEEPVWLTEDLTNSNVNFLRESRNRLKAEIQLTNY